jgi:hypothetical protein
LNNERQARELNTQHRKKTLKDEQGVKAKHRGEDNMYE